MITKDEYISFKQQDVFQEFQGAVYEAVEALGAEIINRSTSDTDRDQFVRGYIRGLITAVEWSPDNFAGEQGETLDNNETED